MPLTLMNVWIQEGWVLLNLVNDPCSRIFVGLSMSAYMKARLAHECTSSTAKIAAWNRQRLRPRSKTRVPEPVVAQKYLEADVMAPTPWHEGA